MFVSRSNVTVYMMQLGKTTMKTAECNIKAAACTQMNTCG